MKDFNKKIKIKRYSRIIMEKIFRLKRALQLKIKIIEKFFKIRIQTWSQISIAR